MSRKMLEEINVDCPAGRKTPDAYDAALYEEMGKPSRGVLVIKVICNFSFKDGKDQSGAALNWAGSDKTGFMDKFRGDVATTWGEQFRLTTTSTVPAVKDVGVIFDIKTTENMGTFSHSHWNLAVTKVGAWTQSQVDHCGGAVWNGKVTLDSLDFRPENKGGPNTQRGAVHEFGHMLGHRDEYQTERGNPSWLGDLDAVMNAGEKIRDRHYAMFAAWLTDQYKTAAHLAREAVDWKVNGTTDVFNARL
jgi:hypothetical protein